MNKIPDWKSVPIFILCRDRLGCLKLLVNWLEMRGAQRITFIDNHSTYPQVRQYFSETCHRVVRPPRHVHPHDLWSRSGVVPRLCRGERYILSDPDTIPDAGCPEDLLCRLWGILDKYPKCWKVGPGIRIDDIPDYYPMKDQVLRHEAQFWKEADTVEPNVYKAVIDTTFALYSHEHSLDRPHPLRLRVGPPYLVRHLSWYLDPSSMPDDEIYYRKNAISGVSHWVPASQGRTANVGSDR